MGRAEPHGGYDGGFSLQKLLLVFVNFFSRKEVFSVLCRIF